MRLVIDTPAEVTAWFNGKPLAFSAGKLGQGVPRGLRLSTCRGDRADCSSGWRLMARAAGQARLVTTFVSDQPVGFDSEARLLCQGRGFGPAMTNPAREASSSCPDRRCHPVFQRGGGDRERDRAVPGCTSRGGACCLRQQLNRWNGRDRALAWEFGSSTFPSKARDTRCVRHSPRSKSLTWWS